MVFSQSVIEGIIDSTGAAARGEETTDLPHPAATDARFSEYLSRVHDVLIIEDAATNDDASTTKSATPAVPTLRQRATSRIKTQIQAQASFNSNIVHALHQLDHRGMYQRKDIADLRSELASAREQITHLQRQIDRLNKKAG